MGAEMIGFTVTGSTKRTEAFLRKMSKGGLFNSLDASAREGVSALIAGTPVDSGLAADSWNYEIENTRNSVTIKWTNNDVENGFPVAIMLQYGHGTGTGGYVQGQDYINPAMKPVFDRIADQVWKAVTSA
jgi:hypothetical protein